MIRERVCLCLLGNNRQYWVIDKLISQNVSHKEKDEEWGK
jgi:hypothetical protein